MEYLGLIYILSAAIQLYFLFVYFLRLSNHTDRKDKNIEQTKLSIIIVFKDELENLKNNIPYLLDQKGVDFELILIDDHSTDGSLEWIKKLNHSSIEVYSLEKEEGKKRGLDLALMKVNYSNLLLTDADCKPASDTWARKMNSLISKEKSIVLGYSRFYKESGFLNLIQRYENFLNGIQYLSYALNGKAYMGTGRNMAYTADLRKNINLPESYFKLKSGDDDLFVNAIKDKNLFQISLDKTSHTVSKAKSTWTQYFYQKRRHLEAGLIYQSKDKFSLAVFGLSQLLFNIAFVLLLALTFYTNLIISIFVIKLVAQMAIYYKLSAKLNERSVWFWVWILEPLYLCLISIIGISIWLKKVDRWK